MLDLLNTKKAATLSPLASSQQPAATSHQSIDGIVAVPLGQIADNPYQPRGAYDPEHILRLAASIKALTAELPSTMGLQQIPLARVGMQKGGEFDSVARHMYASGQALRIIQTRPDACAQLMFGHSRLRAFMLLRDGLRYALKHNHIGIQFNSVAEIESRFAELMDPDGDYATMPLTLGFALDHAMWQHAITENSQRKNINAIEEARSIQRAMEEFGLNTEEAGKPFGYERSTTANKVRLLKLPAEVQKQIIEGSLTERHGRELLRVAADPERVKKLADKTAKSGLTVRQLTESVNWEERHLKEEQEKERQLAVIRRLLGAGWETPMGVPMPAERVSNLDYYKVNGFSNADAKDRILVEQGGCGPHCDCFVLAYRDINFEHGYQPDPEAAPNVCLGCANSKCYYEKRQALGDVKSGDDNDTVRARQAEAAEKKRKIEAMNNEAHTVWQRWLREQDKHALWNSIAFWRVAARYTWQIDPILKSVPDVQSACAEMLKLLYKNTRDYDREIGDYVHGVAEVEKLIKSLGGVSRETEEEGQS